jgi:hypothetical protein
MSREPITSYREFWPFYLREHSRPATRFVHCFGTSLAVILVILAIVFEEPWLLLAALFAGYGFAWLSHLAIERNRPATFSYPLYSLIGDFHMCGLIWLGRLDEELARCLGGPAGPQSPSRSSREA